MPRPLAVIILDWSYTIITSPEPLVDADGDRCRALPDHVDRVIWLDPAVCPAERLEVILEVISNVWRDLVSVAAVA